MNIEELDVLKELSEQTYFGDLPFLYYADLIGKLLTDYKQKCNYIKENEIYKKNLFNSYEEKSKELEKEKEKNKELKWKPIKDYNRKKYDWVLVKYFDGDYECVPEVAEKRSDGKWYTSERQIPFEVKYFFDMQEILEEE